MRLIFSSAIAGAFVIILGLSAAASAQNKKINIIYILADDLGYNELGSYGQTKIRTPHLDQLAASGMRFTQSYSGSPVCAPSRATLMEGKSTARNHVRGNASIGGWDEELGQTPLPEGKQTIGTMLQSAGYKTAIIGKWGLGGPGSTGLPNDHGFDHFFGYLDQKYAHNYYPTHLWRNERVVMLRNRWIEDHQTLEEGFDENDPASYKKFTQVDYAPDLMADEAVNFIDKNKDDPFFLYFAVTIPHVSLQVPSDSLAEYEGAFSETPYTGREQKTWLTYLPHRTPRAAYAAMVTRMDAYVGRIVKKVEELGLGENTLIIFTSDNGPTFNGGSDSQFFESAKPFSGLKGDVREGGIRVPFIASLPGAIRQGQVSGQVTAMWDMMHTFADLTGAEPLEGSDGISIVPTLLGKGGQQQHKSLYWELGSQQAVRMGKWKAFRKNIKRNPKAPIQLYDLESDVSESRDVAKDHPEVVAEIKRIMASRTEAIMDNWNFKVLN